MKFKTSVLLLGIVFVLIFIFCQSIDPGSGHPDPQAADSSVEAAAGESFQDVPTNYKEDYDLESFELTDESGFFTEQRSDRYDFLRNSLYEYLYNNHIDVDAATVMEDGFSFNDARADFIIRYSLDGSDHYINCTYTSDTDSFDFYMPEGTPGRTNDLKEAN
ncbi:hypothetical protein [Eubacterium sp. ER2]|uniref:hypothetical protein n=1 Tax=Eubacterium sp. ER2 TaxID=1519438 RepID=UPI00051AE325|nr:hypothetical protein [Eubacterium sp. ER2]